ncbi:MAG: hypothetical protein OXU64_13430 [Gemmatimonadota bacterium]|nr:hypothetical protein [Gemmatimonadota bacterium]
MVLMLAVRLAAVLAASLVAPPSAAQPVSRNENGVRSLLRFAERVDTSRCGRPAALGVIVHSGYAHTRPDGVAVIPAGALGP